MCGIVGGTNPAWDYQGAVKVLHHRGPDSQQTRSFQKLTLGFTRLAVIDTRDVANQPMSSIDGNVWITYNGEIYGFLQLRNQLIGLGWEFRTESDTEVVLTSYLQWGERFVEHLDGMFAIAIYDRRDESLRLYRDRFGIKPLFYYWDGQDFAFASEIKGIQGLLKGFSPEIDPTAAYDFLTYHYVPTPKTLYTKIRKLPPASQVVFDVHAQTLGVVTTYWELANAFDRPFSGTIEEACSEINYLIDESVKNQMVADVPLGFFLSGGIDSSIVVSSAARSHEAVETFTVGFESHQDSETQFSRIVAEACNTFHHETILTRASYEQSLQLLKDWFDEPFGDTSAFPTYLVSRVAKERVTVALSGDGGDEIFAGYERYGLYPWLNPIRRLQMRRLGALLDRLKGRVRARSIPRRALNLLSIVGDDPLALYTRLMSGMTKAEKSPYAEYFGITADYDDYWYFRKHWREELPTLTRLQYLDFHTYLPDDILTKVDRVSMANSLEVRVPLLCQRIAEFSFSLPESIRTPGGKPKGLLKRAFARRLPRRIIARSKKGFSVPADYKDHPYRRIQEVLLSDVFGIGPHGNDKVK
jgi:asparagine synthase (glutamine-hydrolysing)